MDDIKQPVGLEPGIYFNLAEEIYFADPALSRTDLMHMLDTPNTYWKNSHMNPNKQKRKTNDGMEYGAAFDCLMFEPRKFEKKYQVIPIDAWDEAKQKISHEDYFKIVESIKVLRAGKDSSLFLSGGIPQVTIVFDWNGLRFRTRHDYFTPVLSTDFKTSYTLAEGKLKFSFRDYGYDIQFALYKKAREEIKKAIREGRAFVYGSVPQEFFERFMQATVDGFIFVFQRSSEPFPYLPLMPEDDTEDEGLKRIDQAAKIFRENLARYGLKEWPVCEGKVKAFSMFFGIRNEEN